MKRAAANLIQRELVEMGDSEGSQMTDGETAQGQSGSKASGDSLSSLVVASVAGCW